jgi:hypothetical protein
MGWNETECLSRVIRVQQRQTVTRDKCSLGLVWLLVLVMAKLRDETGSAVEAIVHGDPLWDASDQVLELAPGA